MSQHTLWTRRKTLGALGALGATAVTMTLPIIGCSPAVPGQPTQPKPPAARKNPAVTQLQSQLQTLLPRSSTWLLQNVRNLEDKTLAWRLAAILAARGMQQEARNIWAIAYAQVATNNALVSNQAVQASTLLCVARHAGFKLSPTEQSTLDHVAGQQEAGLVDDYTRAILAGKGAMLIGSPANKGLRDNGNPSAPQLQELLALMLTLDIMNGGNKAASKKWAIMQTPQTTTEIAQMLHLAVVGGIDNTLQGASDQALSYAERLVDEFKSDGTVNGTVSSTEGTFLATTTATLALAEARRHMK